MSRSMAGGLMIVGGLILAMANPETMVLAVLLFFGGIITACTDVE